jgi:hypothetical protein
MVDLLGAKNRERLLRISDIFVREVGEKARKAALRLSLPVGVCWRALSALLESSRSRYSARSSATPGVPRGWTW